MDLEIHKTRITRCDVIHKIQYSTEKSILVIKSIRTLSGSGQDMVRFRCYQDHNRAFYCKEITDNNNGVYSNLK